MTRPVLLREYVMRCAASILLFLTFAATVALPVPLAEAQHTPMVLSMKPDEAYEAATRGEIILIDIRRPEEWRETGVAQGAIAMDMTGADFLDRLIALREAHPQKRLALICRTGNRTSHVTQLLTQQGFADLIDVKEGMIGGRYGPGWLNRGLPVYEGTDGNIRAFSNLILP